MHTLVSLASLLTVQASFTQLIDNANIEEYYSAIIKPDDFITEAQLVMGKDLAAFAAAKSRGLVDEQAIIFKRMVDRQSVAKAILKLSFFQERRRGDYHFDAIRVADATMHIAILLRRVEFAKVLLGDAQRTPDDRRDTFNFLEALRRPGPAWRPLLRGWHALYSTRLPQPPRERLSRLADRRRQPIRADRARPH